MLDFDGTIDHRDGPSFQLPINHHDAAGEFEYSGLGNGSLDFAKKYGFMRRA